MKRGCKNGMHNIEDRVYFMVLVDDLPYIVKYKVIEKIESIDGFSYVIEAMEDQEDPGIREMVLQKRIGSNFRICGDSLFKTEEECMNKARDYFAMLVDQLS
jgi:hypothetical protein